GKLGNIKFEKGNYIYVGSSQNGVEKRIKRHLKKRKKKFWHIDYLVENKNVLISKVYCKKGGKDEECRIAGELIKYSEPVLRFGCSDCNCTSHLFKVNLSKIRWYEDLLRLYPLFS
ncbi:DUF123 domain-containing protein, partial [Candidatus Calescamantes bacterium]|nr:DUF123 domain-containing protein [Candidatus Calescamantes bacterium]